MTEKNKNPKVESKVKSASKSGKKKKPAPLVFTGVVAASGTALVVISVIGLTPAILAGAAGYAAYYGMTRQKAA